MTFWPIWVYWLSNQRRNIQLSRCPALYKVVLFRKSSIFYFMKCSSVDYFTSLSIINRVKRFQILQLIIHHLLVLAIYLLIVVTLRSWRYAVSLYARHALSIYESIFLNCWLIIQLYLFSGTIEIRVLLMRIIRITICCLYNILLFYIRLGGRFRSLAFMYFL